MFALFKVSDEVWWSENLYFREKQNLRKQKQHHQVSRKERILRNLLRVEKSQKVISSAIFLLRIAWNSYYFWLLKYWLCWNYLNVNTPTKCSVGKSQPEASWMNGPNQWGYLNSYYWPCDLVNRGFWDDFRVEIYICLIRVRHRFQNITCRAAQAAHNVYLPRRHFHLPCHSVKQRWVKLWVLCP